MSNKISYEEMHERILRGALAEFSSKGYSVATIKDISNRVQCNAITIFRHFDDKESLFYQVVERYNKLELDEDLLQSKLSYTNIHADFSAMADYFFETLYKNLHILRIFINDGPAFEKIAKYAWYLPAPLKTFVINYIETVYPGQISPSDAALLAEMAVAYVTRTALRTNVHDGITDYTRELAKEANEVMQLSVEMIVNTLMICIEQSKQSKRAKAK